MNSVHILLVEDNEGDIVLTTEAFEEWEMVTIISVVKDGNDAINFLGRDGKYGNRLLPDLVLLDINLPKKNGQEVLCYIKSHNELKDIPVIMLTTSSSGKDIETSYRNKADAYMTKPLLIEPFFDIISKIESLRSLVPPGTSSSGI